MPFEFLARVVRTLPRFESSWIVINCDFIEKKKQNISKIKYHTRFESIFSPCFFSLWLRYSIKMNEFIRLGIHKGPKRLYNFYSLSQFKKKEKNDVTWSSFLVFLFSLYMRCPFFADHYSCAEQTNKQNNSKKTKRNERNCAHCTCIFRPQCNCNTWCTDNLSTSLLWSSS